MASAARYIGVRGVIRFGEHLLAPGDLVVDGELVIADLLNRDDFEPVDDESEDDDGSQ